MYDMFYQCSGLKTIYCNFTWNSDNRMFAECNSQKGAITYDEAKVDGTYANPDTGYFTRKESNSISVPSVSYGMEKNDAWYTLGGQRIAAPQRGINITGGKKVMVK